MLKLNHKNLTVWKKSIELTRQIYLVTKDFPKYEQFGLISQIRRSTVSIAANIAEGASRRSSKESSRFYEIARSSLVELDTHIEISIIVGYLEPKDITEIELLTNEVFAMLTAMK